MKAELRLKPHNFGTRNAAGAPVVVEVWFGGAMVGAIYGADGPGIRFISKYPLEAVRDDSTLHVVEVTTRPE